MSAQLDAFARIFSEFKLGVRSMNYQTNKNGRIPEGERKMFSRLEERVDEAWRAVPPFEQAVFGADNPRPLREKKK